MDAGTKQNWICYGTTSVWLNWINFRYIVRFIRRRCVSRFTEIQSRICDGGNSPPHWGENTNSRTQLHERMRVRGKWPYRSLRGKGHWVGAAIKTSNHSFADERRKCSPFLFSFREEKVVQIQIENFYAFGIRVSLMRHQKFSFDLFAMVRMLALVGCTHSPRVTPIQISQKMASLWIRDPNAERKWTKKKNEKMFGTFETKWINFPYFSGQKIQSNGFQ